jgi:hypothetical protein
MRLPCENLSQCSLLIWLFRNGVEREKKEDRGKNYLIIDCGEKRKKREKLVSGPSTYTHL